MALQPNQICIVSDALTVKATAAVTKYRFIGYNGQHCAANGAAIGVSYFDAAIGDPITIYGAGNIVPLEAGGSFSAGAMLASDANGKGVAASAVAIASGATSVTSAAANGATDITGGSLPQTVNAMAMQQATAGGDIVSVLVW